MKPASRGSGKTFPVAGQVPTGGKAMSEVVACDHSCNVVFVLGMTRSGRPFRPSDWVDRLAGRCSTFGKDKLLKYSPSVRPLTVEGMRGLRVDIRLVESDPAAFRFVMGFAADNDLAIQCLEAAARGDSRGDKVSSVNKSQPSIFLRSVRL
jgi:hypothetical protein